VVKACDGCRFALGYVVGNHRVTFRLPHFIQSRIREGPASDLEFINVAKYPMIHDRAPKKIQHLVSLKTGNEQGERRFD
jgi:hypothetical protein